MFNADLILHSGHIITLDKDNSTASALAIWQDRIIAVGNQDELINLSGPTTRKVNLKGATVLPGFIDTHNHALQTGIEWTKVQLREAASIEEVLKALADQARITKKGKWILASMSWHESRLREKRLPTRSELDAACPDHPVCVPRGAYVRAVNSQAFSLAGINDDCPDPEAGSYGRDPSGKLNGLIIGQTAFMPIFEQIPKPTEDDRIKAIQAMCDAYNAAGLTSISDAGLFPEDIRTYQTARSLNSLTLRVNLLPYLSRNLTQASNEEIQDQLLQWGPVTGFGDHWMRLGSIKIVLDGGVEAACLKEPYAHDSKFFGQLTISEERLELALRQCISFGWSTAVHACGDAASEALLTAYEAVNKDFPLKERRCSIEHFFLPDDTVFERVKKLGLIINVQVPLMYALAANMIIYWGEPRAHRVLPVKTWIDSGIEPTGGSDSYVTPYEPLLGIYATVTRQSDVAGVIGSDQKVSPLTALRMYTSWAARATFEENLKGSLEVGKLADLIVLSENPLTCNPEDIRDIQIIKTMVGGRWVYEA